MSSPIDRNRAIIEEFRANAGKVGGPFAGKTLLLLHTIGAKTAREHVNPVAYVRDGERFVIIASKGGAPTNPDWFHNIRGNPRVMIELGEEQFPALATIAGEPERTRLYDRMVAMMPVFDEYRLRTARVIPVIILTRENRMAS